MKINIDEETDSLMKKKHSQIEDITNKENNILKVLKVPNITIKINERSSSFEILRIIAMFLIILSHIIFHTNSLPKLSTSNYINIINNRYIFLRIISNYGKFGDIIFILISGYFSIKRTNFHFKKFILLITQIYFYHYLFLYLGLKLKNIYKDIHPLEQKNGSYFLYV